jgi:hypothetical protein
MKHLINIKNNLLRGFLFSTVIFLVLSFVVKPVEDYDVIAATAVKIEQENDALAVSITASKNSNTRFYMFTVEGRLIKELSIYGSKKINITQLEKGIYIYDFFSNDERLKNGKIELK